jgi:hypothetical protein
MVCALLQLLEDVQEESSKYGTVEGIAVPRPPPDTEEGEMGRVYVKFASSEEVQKAKDIFHNRQFDGFNIEASFAPEEDFERASRGEWIRDAPKEPVIPQLPPPPGCFSCRTCLQEVPCLQCALSQPWSFVSAFGPGV